MDVDHKKEGAKRESNLGNARCRWTRKVGVKDIDAQTTAQESAPSSPRVRCSLALVDLDGTVGHRSAAIQHLQTTRPVPIKAAPSCEPSGGGACPRCSCWAVGLEGHAGCELLPTWTSPTMSGESATGSASLGLLRQCEEGLKAIEAAADVESMVAAMRAHARRPACRRRRVSHWQTWL